VPALYASRLDLSDALQQGGSKATASRTSSRLRSGLVVAEVAFSVILLATAGLLVRSFQALQHRTTRRPARPRSLLLMGLLGKAAGAKRVALRSKINRLREPKDALIFRIMELEQHLKEQARREDDLREEVLRLSLQSRPKGRSK
jgi:hypothetical protein